MKQVEGKRTQESRGREEQFGTAEGREVGILPLSFERSFAVLSGQVRRERERGRTLAGQSSRSVPRECQCYEDEVCVKTHASSPSLRAQLI